MVYLIAAMVALFIFVFCARNVEAWTLTGGTKIPMVPVYPYSDFIMMSSRTWGVPVALIRAIIKTESNGNPDAISSKGCYGLMQISLMVAEDFGYVKEWQNPTEYEISRILNPQTNINIGTRQLSLLLGKFPFDEAIQKYNTGIRGYDELGFRASGYLGTVKGYYNDYTK